MKGVAKAKELLKKYWWVLLIVLAVVAFFVWRMIKRRKEAAAATKPGTIAGTTPRTTDSAAVTPAEATPAKTSYEKMPLGTFPLQRRAGATKLNYLLQLVLNEVYGAGLKLDGIFGPLTEAALKKAKNVTTVDKTLALELYKEFAAKKDFNTDPAYWLAQFQNQFQ